MSLRRENEPPNEVPLVRQPDLLLVLDTPKGRGVFAKVRLEASTIIEISPVLILPPVDADAACTTVINHYSYNWPWFDPTTEKTVTTQALALGLGSLFNHSRHPNVGFQRDVQRQCIVYTTLRDIASREELCISYGSHLWFDDTEGREESSPKEITIEDLNRMDLFS